MEKIVPRVLGLLGSILFLSACANNLHETYCNWLRSQLVFNGSTSVERKADIQKSEKPLIQHTYNVNCE